MADIVLGLASARSPMVNLPPERWTALGENDKARTGMRRGDGQLVTYDELLAFASPAIAARLTSEIWEAQYAAGQCCVSELADTLIEVNPDVVLMMGDDQEVFVDGDNRPGILAYRGGAFPTFIASTVAGIDPERVEQPVAVGLTGHIIRSLVDQEFDIADSVALSLVESNGGKGGHEFGWAYNRLMAKHPRPIVPFILNVHYPPNTPSPKRLYEFGRAVRRAVQSWPGDEKVAVIGTGGLSVGVLEEEVDRSILTAMASHDVDALAKLNRDRLQGPTGETLLYIATAGAAEHLKMEVLDYIPAYRTPAGTGCGMAFVRWQ